MRHVVWYVNVPFASSIYSKSSSSFDRFCLSDDFWSAPPFGMIVELPSSHLICIQNSIMITRYKKFHCDGVLHPGMHLGYSWLCPIPDIRP